MRVKVPCWCLHSCAITNFERFASLERLQTAATSPTAQRAPADTRAACATCAACATMRRHQCSKALLAARHSVQKKNKNQAGHLATHRDASQSSAELLVPRENLWPVESQRASSYTPGIYGCTKTQVLCVTNAFAPHPEATTHTTQSAADGRREGSRRHRWFSASRRE